ncbi:MAG: nickel pincer cofactor biosynthesis protein LarC [bacterium]|nr:nickel pincer cofactor biosynthesis protein LarC [bacterium]
MKTLYIECNTGVAGDMLGAALLEIYGDREGFIKMINEAGIEGVTVSADNCVRCGVAGTKLDVNVYGEIEHEHSHEHHHEHVHGHTHHHEHHGHSHASYASILEKISAYNIPDKVKKDAAAVYKIIGEAEARVHGCMLENIHFHEVGTLDAVADVIISCWLMSLINPDRVICSPVCTGSGTVHCAHGILSVPAPAVAEIIKGIPVYAGKIKSELTTPTGAALVKYFADSFGEMPLMTVERNGSGMGTKELEQVNCVRAFLGSSGEDNADSVCVIRCNIDDMTGEDFGYACDKLMSCGALDVFTVPIYMKKNRPGVVMVCICTEEKRGEMIELLFRYTSTRGLRYSSADRAKLTSSFYEKETEYGAVKIKKSQGFGTVREKPEFDSMKKLAEENGVSIEEIRKKVYKI